MTPTPKQRMTDEQMAVYLKGYRIGHAEGYKAGVEAQFDEKEGIWVKPTRPNPNSTKEQTKKAHAAGFAEGVEKAAEVCEEENEKHKRIIDVDWRSKSWAVIACIVKIRQLKLHQPHQPGKGE